MGFFDYICFLPEDFSPQGLGYPLSIFFSPKLQLIVYGLMKTKKNLGNFAKYLCNLVSGFCKGYQMHLGWIQPGLGSSQWLSDGS